MSNDDDIKCPACGNTKFDLIKIVTGKGIQWQPGTKMPLFYGMSNPIETYRCRECDYILWFARPKKR